jgi:hypothetical protein
MKEERKNDVRKGYAKRRKCDNLEVASINHPLKSILLIGYGLTTAD